MIYSFGLPPRADEEHGNDLGAALRHGAAMSSAHQTEPGEPGHDRIAASRAKAGAEQMDADDGCTSRSRSRPRVVLTMGAVVVLLCTELVFVAPYARRAAHQLSDAQPAWFLLAVAAEMVSMAAFARLQRLALSTGGLRVGLRAAVSAVFAGNALSATLPGGSLVSITYRTRRMRTWGASVPLIGFTHAVTGVLCAVALVLLAGIGGTLAGDSAQLAGAVIRLSAACAVTVAALALVRRTPVLRRPVSALLRVWQRLRRGKGGQTSADGLLGELAAMRPPARFWALGLGAALINWAGDLVCVLAVCHAVGSAPASDKVLLAYVAAMTAVSALPLLPAGLGPLDAALVLTLHHGGMPMAAATAADLLYRTLNPGLIGVAGWSVLLVRRRRRSVRGRIRPQSPYRVADPLQERGVEHGRLEDVAG
ncbi:lysylphosphatidylglycerol synthase transmembrane domain-containing protein [Streptomyces sp. NPDC001792]|uniref:lysylphosphatidylglycerol synthase transmembrane domain-containing protein n=1 Tax=unclassified Streptomyces TaxID=2593676 RepID=UPI00331A199B